ncbi:MAG: hypothetical protein NUW00_02460 [Candidatus Kaiserbacteria bacterium]|nr:hypothetical protein [Candidatus Kaiserbacteria bacterium]
MNNARIDVQPLPYKKRQRTFLFLVLVFAVSLPFLYLYATGYRFDFKRPTNLVSTGGIYVAVEGTGAEIFIDGELVRETRTFRKAFYAQNLDVGTHRLHVQKDGYHTWVKELPVSKRLVTEAEAFNLPLVPQVRVVSPWQTATGTTVVRGIPTNASSTNILYATTTTATSTFIQNTEYGSLLAHFGTTTEVEGGSVKETRAINFKELLDATTTSESDESLATSTIVQGGVRLGFAGEDLYATWVGSFEQMPYYYCAPDFPPYSTATVTAPFVLPEILDEETDLDEIESEEFVIHPVQTVPKDTACEPSIRIDRKWQSVQDFDFFPGSTDLVVLALEDGVYVVEIDDRSWQNVQPIMRGSNLRFYIESNNIYVYDGNLIYQILLQTE